MKQYLVLAPLLMVCFGAQATSGRTDKNGCHNSKTQGYHCHGGPVKSSGERESVKTSQEPVVKYSVTGMEYLNKANDTNTTSYNFEICVQSLQEKSKEWPSELIENSRERYAAKFSPPAQKEEVIICHVNNRKTILYL